MIILGFGFVDHEFFGYKNSGLGITGGPRFFV